MNNITKQTPSTVFVTLNVKLLNPETVRNFLKNTGEFANVCTASKVDPVKIAKHCLTSHHWTPARADFWKFEISGVSRVLSHQAVRHKIGVEFNQESQRYVPNDVFSAIMPPLIESNPAAKEIFINHMNSCWNAYDSLVKLGIPREDARYVFANAAETKFNIALTPQAFFHFCNERLCTRAQWEIRYMCESMVSLVLKEEPAIAPLCVPRCDVYGGCPEARGSCGRREKLPNIFEEGVVKCIKFQ